MKIYNFIFILFIGAFFGSCDQKGSGRTEGPGTEAAVKKISKLNEPRSKLKVTIGDSIPINLSWPDSLSLDSAQVYFRGSATAVFTSLEGAKVATNDALPGKAGVRVKLFFSNQLVETQSTQVELLSDIVPGEFTYKLSRKYVHDRAAYTQGLFYYDGWLYESTGNYNESTIRKVRLEDGEVVQIRNNASDIFGEGIALFDNRIYQLTYKSQTCFVYDLNTFNEIQKFYFQNKEGWGLTSYKDELLMSDGTHILYYIDPEMFTVKRQLEVYDHEGIVDSLNELEYINGKIYANRYYTDEIVIIDPESGKVESRIDLKGILPVKDRKANTNVLNGIAWDKEGGRLFVTGKYWPWLYEIQLVPAV